MQQPRSLTKFLCCNMAIRATSFLNSTTPWPEPLQSLFTAISLSPSVPL
uniref:Uncharacterized protein n=1 Tax=Arundo donax TaxID=35708 RepID=A0A0A9FZ13_ARUDO